MRKVFVKRSFIICLLLVILAGVYYYRASKRIYIDLEYLECIENVDTSRYGVGDCLEFTWWERFSWFGSTRDNAEYNTYTFLADNYGISLPDNINWEEKDVVVSFGRELKTLYYYESWDQFGGHVGRPVFMKKYKGSVAFVYLINKTYLRNNDLVTTDMYTFNIEYKIPFTEDAADEWFW